jgi:hypothetical protein
MLSNTAIAENQPVTFANSPVENRHDDPFTVRDGRYVGHDGFVVPKNFDEFDQRFPHYVRNWVSSHAEKSAHDRETKKVSVAPSRRIGTEKKVSGRAPRKK